jgi:hypothetical protein
MEEDSDLAALDYFDALMSSIAARAMDGSGLKAQLQNLKAIFTLGSFDLSKVAPLTEDEKVLYQDMVKKSMEMRNMLNKKLGNTLAKWFLRSIDYDIVGSRLADDLATHPTLKQLQRFTQAAGSSVLMFNVKQGVIGLGNYHRLFGLSDSNAFKYYTVDWLNAVAHTREAWALLKENPELLRRLKQSGFSEHALRIVDENSDSIFTDVQSVLMKKGKVRTSDIVAQLGTASNIMTKYGLMPNVLGDVLGLAWANYAVRKDVVARVRKREGARLQKNFGGFPEEIEERINRMADREISSFINSHVSSSNYMSKGLVSKWLNKAGLGAVVMFTNDQLQSFGSLLQALNTIVASNNAEEKARARKDITAWFVSTARYIAIKSGWMSGLAVKAIGRELTEEEEKAIVDSVISETIVQFGGFHPLSNLVWSPAVRAAIEGERFSMSTVPSASAGRIISSGRDVFMEHDFESFIKFGSELGSATAFPVFNGLHRLIAGFQKQLSDNEYEQQVGTDMLFGTSETGSMKKHGYVKNQKTGEIRPKKKLKKTEE